MRSITFLVVTALAAVLAVACGGGEETPSPSTTPTPQTPISIGAKSTLTVAEQPNLGTIVVDGDGLTLYVFLRDEAGKSNCSGGCAQAWPPLVPSQVHLELAGEGVNSELVGTMQRQDGTSQVTYNGRPLYNFSGDQQPGDANGQSSGRVWFVVSQAGEPIETP